MASISSPGLGSGLDVNGIITKLMAVERQPLTVLAAKEAGYQAKISAYGSLKSVLASLQSAAEKLADPDTYTGISATSSDIDVLTVSSSSSAAAASYNVSVTALAKHHALRSNGNYTATTNTFTTGSLSIAVGSGSPVAVTINNTNNTLAGIRDAINAADAGVTASIVNDGTYQRLLLTSGTIGSNGTISISVTDGGSGGSFALGALATGSGFDLPGDVGDPPYEYNYTQTQAADDAQLSINGLAITRSSNTIDDAIEGLSLTLKEPGSSTVKVGANTAATVSAFDAFVKAFNESKKQIAALSNYDTAGKKAAVLTGDATVRNIQSRLNQLLFSSVAGVTGDIAALSDIGVELQKDGSLSLNTAKLTTALTDPGQDVQSLLTQTTAGNEGVAVRFASSLDAWIESDGLLDNRTDGINATIRTLQKQYETFETRLERIEARYRTQFSALDSLIASLNQTSQYLTQQLANLPKVSSN